MSKSLLENLYPVRDIGDRHCEPLRGHNLFYLPQRLFSSTERKWRDRLTRVPFDPELKNPCLKWWDDAAIYLGHYRDIIVSDVTEDKHGNEYILFTNGRTMSLETAQRSGWERVLQYCIEQGLAPSDA